MTTTTTTIDHLAALAARGRAPSLADARAALAAGTLYAVDTGSSGDDEVVISDTGALGALLGVAAFHLGDDGDVLAEAEARGWSVDRIAVIVS